MMIKNRYFIVLGIVILGLVSANELGLGIVAFIPLMLLAMWLMRRALGQQ